jgi:hypothetical protein
MDRAKRLGRTHKALFLAIIGSTLVIQVTSILPAALTTDEPTHYRYGYDIIVHGRFDDIRNGPMPFSVVNALPYKLATVLPRGALQDLLYNMKTGRLVTILFSSVVCCYVFKWARELYGPRAGLLALALYGFCPTVIAHSRLITTDVFGAGWVLVALYYFWRLVNRGGWVNTVASGVTLGASQLAKYVCIFLYPIFALILLVVYSKDIAAWLRGADRERAARCLKAAGLRAAVLVAVSLLILNAGYFFSGTMKPFPLPLPYLNGLALAKSMVDAGTGFGNIYLLGHLRESGLFKGYYLVAYLLKVPIAIQVMLILAIVYYLRNRRAARFLRDEVFLAVPVAVFSVYLNFFFGMQVGIRYLLLVFPLLYVFCGSLLRDGTRVSPRLGVVIGGLLVYLVISVLSYHPHYISYFNELVWDRKMAYKYLADSNLDWGENQPYLEAYLESHPDAVYLGHKPEGRREARATPAEAREAALPDSGLVVIRANDLVGIHRPERFRWLREHCRPVDHVAYSYLVFELHPGDAKAPY